MQFSSVRSTMIGMIDRPAAEPYQPYPPPLPPTPAPPGNSSASAVFMAVVAAICALVLVGSAAAVAIGLAPTHSGHPARPAALPPLPTLPQSRRRAPRPPPAPPSVAPRGQAAPRDHHATVLGTDPAADVALLQLQGASGLATVTVADSSTLTVGQAVIAIGNALGRGGAPSVTSGSITALDQTITASDGNGPGEQLSGLIESDASISPGDSGGALVNTSGQVVGMITAGPSSPRPPPPTPTTVRDAIPPYAAGGGGHPIPPPP